MTRTDFKVLFTALGFLAVVMKGENANNDGADKARKLAGLIEEFCIVTHPEQFGRCDQVPSVSSTTINDMINHFKGQLVNKGDASLPHDRPTLLQFYEQLIVRQTRLREQHFYQMATDDLIANRVLAMIDEEIKADEGEEI